MKIFPSIILLSLSFASHISFGSYPKVMDVLGRDLNVKGLEIAGHVGLGAGLPAGFNAITVLEVLNEHPVIQVNSIENFKKRSRYWGSRTGLADNGVRTNQSMTVAAIQNCLCNKYSYTSKWKPARGNYDTILRTCNIIECGLWRCDTFVNWVYATHGLTLNGYNSWYSVPVNTFYSLPRGNADGPLAQDNKMVVKKSLLKSKYTITNVPQSELYRMSPNEFLSIVDAPLRYTSAETNRMINLALDEKLEEIKRVFVLDAIRFTKDISLFPKLIDVYKNASETKVKEQALDAIEAIYQSSYDKEKNDYLTQNPNEKMLLRNFFAEYVDNPNQDIYPDVPIRGFASLSDKTDIVNRINKFITLADKRIDPKTRIGLLTDITFRAKDTESIVIPYLLKVLQQSKDMQLDERFNRFVIDALNENPNNLTPNIKKLISIYLAKNEPLSNNTLKAMSAREPIPYYANSVWLEASALINSKTLDEAAKYIVNFVVSQPESNREIYLVGLSNAKYIKNAFIKEKLLQKYKTIHENSQIPATPWDAKNN